MEHPITECITGVDIVKEMIRVAAGISYLCVLYKIVWNQVYKDTYIYLSQKEVTEVYFTFCYSIGFMLQMLFS